MADRWSILGHSSLEPWAVPVMPHWLSCLRVIHMHHAGWTRCPTKLEIVIELCSWVIVLDHFLVTFAWPPGFSNLNRGPENQYRAAPTSADSIMLLRLQPNLVCYLRLSLRCQAYSLMVLYLDWPGLCIPFREMEKTSYVLTNSRKETTPMLSLDMVVWS